jgi:hypothetical protein
VALAERIRRNLAERPRGRATEGALVAVVERMRNRHAQRAKGTTKKVFSR